MLFIRTNATEVPDGEKTGEYEAPCRSGVVMTFGAGVGSVNVVRGTKYTSDLVVLAWLSVGSLAKNVRPYLLMS